MKNVVIGIVVVVVLAAAWFFLSPLFIDETVDEPLEFPTRADVEAMAPAERDRTMDDVMNRAAEQPDVVMDESMGSMTNPQAVKRGQFRDGDAIHKGSGDAIVYRLADGSHVLRLENLKVTNGPALVVYLAEHPNPTAAGDVTPGFVNLGDLKGNVGNQNYPIPDDVDVSRYGSAVIWCELFGVLFSPAALEAG